MSESNVMGASSTTVKDVRTFNTYIKTESIHTSLPGGFHDFRVE